MTDYTVLLFLHVSSVILWVGAGTTLGLLWLHPDGGLRDRIPRLGEWLGPRLFAPAALGALGFGLGLAFDGHWGFGPLWIKLGLVSFALSFLVNAGVRPRLTRRFAEEPKRGAVLLSWLAAVELTVLYLTVADMVLKP